MALAHTILTVLCEKDASGYDISKQFEESMACYWTASQQQIYRELGRIEQNGWACSQVVPQQGKPDRKVYAITEAGRQELRQWAAEPSIPTPIREDLLVKVLGGPYAAPDQLLAEVQRRRAVHTAQLASYQEKETLFRSHTDLPLQEQYRYLTLRRGILFEQEWIRWCDEVIAFLKAQPGPLHSEH
ncbi:PadR family transcriptional regulator [Synechococcus sp. Cruz-9H2]|uniref:PadR family transcriptional regulator n=1 Tax=unclassified Synechococcus TaxID=2626047 RepID=UPI0020CF8870|nr:MULTISPECIES: PadR family transcriptional regulator [unclassified Synechococcus]MCP9819424.1 PadR family transcriptional regulator [Synechococcus sp. Cruz-9H2]MCP9843218.1 PadR family transcriptional regulator [Synechococcus sp. Edmonson 11F2]MCP9854963.1 PadR family transcriptional regulator [Synechococcus sp. Cruz-9C9]MCP9862566.1 PadR family transcriptional regulator [Synechococcus sp. Cruz-7E5]MCP9870335.1 PadR family transcriptional regulator [Synechococcus sp. Cruz-7B9]